MHISRLEALKLQIQQQAEVLYANQLDFVDAAARQMYAGSYYHTAFEVQRGLGVGWTMHAINENTITKVLSRPWTVDGQTFRDRCWINKRDLVNSVNTQLTQMIIRGEAPDRAINAIAHQFKVSKGKAGRLVMTESAYFSSAAQKDCYGELGVERYKIVASFDRDTCELCGALDGKVFKMSEYQVGLTAPPFHPWCRCCTCPYFEDMTKVGERWTRNPDGTTAKVPADMTFEEWRERFVGNKGVSAIKVEDILRNSGSDYSLNRNRDTTHRKISPSGNQIISEPVYRKLVTPVQHAGGIVLRGTPEVEAHLEKVGASASTLGDAILFRQDATTSDVLEEVYHFWQNRRRINDDKPGELRTILNEIDAKQYLLSVAKKYKIPLEEVELTKDQLKGYQHMLDSWKGGTE